MPPTPYYFQVSHGPPTRLRLLMNGVPFYRCVPETEGTTHGAAANHLLMPSGNVLTLEAMEVDTFFAIVVELTIQFDHTAPVLRMDWPKMWKGLPDEAKIVPFRHDMPFEVHGVSFTPAYVNAPKADFDHRGTPELREAVRQYHETIAKGDIDGFMAQNTLKIEECDRAYEGHPAFAPGFLRQPMAERFQAGVEARPLDFDELQFESFAGGRVAYVTRRDGGHALAAASENGDMMTTDLWLTQQGGLWRVFR
jgi:hypothetical protein